MVESRLIACATHALAVCVIFVDAKYSEAEPHVPDGVDHI